MTTLNTNIADQAHRDQALNPEQSFIVQSPAGSGKTGLLVQRYLKLLALVDNPEEIIATTFTRKAAAEMKNRILAALEKAKTGQLPKAQYEQKTFELATAALQRNQQKNWQITSNPQRLKIQTLDSLCGALARQMPLSSGLGAQLEIVEDAEELYQQAADDTLSKLDSSEPWSDDIATLILHLDNDLPKLRNLIVAMLTKRDQWFDFIKKHNRNIMESVIEQRIKEQLALLANQFSLSAREKLMALLKFAANNLKKLKPESDNAILACVGMSKFPEANTEALIYWRGISTLLLTNNGYWRKRIDKNCGFPANDKDKKQEFYNLRDELEQVAGLEQALAKVMQLPIPHYTNEEWRIINSLCEVLKLAATQLQLVFSARKQIDFIHIASAAIDALVDNNGQPTDLAMVLDYRIKHLLVDEFQDISDTQYKLLECLTQEWIPNDGHSLFLVGDPMQSIYSFREAEVSLFIKTFNKSKQGYLGSNIALEALRLTVNFRSQQAIVDWVNTNFNAIFPVQYDEEKGAVKFSKATAYRQHNPEDGVVVKPLYERDDELEAAQIVSIINQLKHQGKQQSIAILSRSRTHLDTIIPTLKKENIRFIQRDLESLTTQPFIQDLLSLTRAYLFLADRIAWLASLRAPWTGLKIASLLLLTDTNKTIWECINDEKLTEKLAADEQQRLNRFKEIFTTVLNDRQRLPMRQTIEYLWCQLGGPATLAAAHELENCEQFFYLLDELDQGGVVDIQQLTKKIGSLYALPENSEEKIGDLKIELMTIHKAKGLEFDHVIVPGLGRKPRHKDSELLAWLSQRQEPILAPIPAAGSKQSPLYDYINDINKEKQYHEDARLLYVAITRAKNNLHLIGHVKDCKPQSKSLLAHLFKAEAVKRLYEKNGPSDSLATESKGNNNESNIDKKIKRLAKDWQLPELSEKFIKPAIENEQQSTQQQDANANKFEFNWASKTLRHIGSVVHYTIQWITEEGLEHWNSHRIKSLQPYFNNELQRLGVPKNDLTQAVETIQCALENMLDDERGRWLLAGHHNEQKSEYRITGIYQNNPSNVILDRTFIDVAGIRWVIDYKTSQHQGADIEQFLDSEQQRYQLQLEKYATIISQLDNRPIKLGLYFPLLTAWREWEFCQ